MKNKKKPTKKVKPIRNNAEKKIAPEGVKLVSEYWEFVQFCSLPTVYREKVMGVSTHEEFAKKFHIESDTLTRWKKREDFWQEAIKLRRKFFIERSGNVILGMENKAIKSGDASAGKVILQYTGEMKEDSDPTAIPEAVSAAVAKIMELLK